MAIANTNTAPILVEGSNITLTQSGQTITIASSGGGGSGTPGGIDTQVQFNDSGSFGGDAGLTYDKTNNILDLESIDFAVTPTAATAPYRLNTDDTEGSLSLGLKGGNVNIAIGAEVIIMSYNAEATTLNKGEVVYLFSAQGQRPSVKRASNTGDATSATTFGMVAESIAAGGEGFIIQIGVLRNINTNAYNEGDILWLGATPGTVTTTKPYAPNHGVFVGVVLKKNASSGRIFVKPQNGYELDEIHDVQISSPADKNLLMYELSTDLWKNSITLSTDTTLASNSDALLSSQKAVKTYVDAKFATRFARRHDYAGGFSYCGTAAFGSADSAAAWYITRIPINANGTVGTVQRSPNNSIWNNRVSLTYT